MKLFGRNLYSSLRGLAELFLSMCVSPRIIRLIKLFCAMFQDATMHFERICYALAFSLAAFFVRLSPKL